MKQIRPHVLVAGVLVVAMVAGWHNGLRNALTDLRFHWISRSASNDIVVVAIDAPSIEKIGTWPWPRRLHAELLNRLNSAGVKDIVFDVDFSTPSDPASDSLFLTALQNSGGSVVLPSFKQPGPEGSIFFNRPLKEFGEHAWSAVVNVPIEADGLVRRYPLGQKLDNNFLPSMAAVLAGKYDDKGVPFLIDFGIRATTIEKASFVDVLNGDKPTLDRIKNKKVIIGGTALELGDRFSIPNGGIISGPVLQALAAESILENRELHWTSSITTAIGIAGLGLMMLLLWGRLSAGKRVALLSTTAAAVEGAAYLLQAHFPLVVDTALLHISIVGYFAAIALEEIDARGLLGRVAENRFHRIAMSLGDGLICTDKNYLITEWNPGASTIFGYEEADMIGRPFQIICNSDMDKSVIQNVNAQRSGQVAEFDGRRSGGEVFPVEASFSSWQGTEGVQYGVILRDISVRKREAEKIRYLAEHDVLTGLVNRYKLEADLEAMIISTKGTGSKVALLIVALEEFQQINDLFGHSNGDLVLRAVSERLTGVVGSAAIVARLSGDEFAVAVSCLPDSEDLSRIVFGITEAFDQPVTNGSRSHRVKVIIGASVFPSDGRDADELLANGHLALQRAKSIKGCGAVFFKAEIRQELETRLHLEAELALAGERGEFELFYQPQVHLCDNKLIGAEALIRWRHPERGLVSPAMFMPVVNTSSISEKIAQWVLETGCRQARAWEIAGHKLRVGVNLSPSQLHSGDLAGSVAAVLMSTRLSPELLELEVTEDILLVDEERVLKTFQRIRDLGVRIVFDDFGTGYASLSYLKKFPLDGLKIDQSFVRNLQSNNEDAAIVDSTIHLSKQLGLSVIAEGIEDGITATVLTAMGCKEGQGYFFGKPMPVADLEREFLRPADPPALARLRA